ncbi:hypothetical protein G9A89_015955 [Geosiphon pyriformis]|nr:hypothetical protein G9A89_015955 [Geosiphon pyriformis]
MGGSNLELFKFGLYVFFPIVTMYYVGGPEFYEKHVKGTKFWPPPEQTNNPPRSAEDLLIELEKYKAKQATKRVAGSKVQAAATNLD